MQGRATKQLPARRRAANGIHCRIWIRQRIVKCQLPAALIYLAPFVLIALGFGVSARPGEIGTLFVDDNVRKLTRDERPLITSPLFPSWKSNDGSAQHPVISILQCNLTGCAFAPNPERTGIS